jgi:signal transduction histidine kinase
VAQPTPELEKIAADLGLGRWIWTTNFADKQTCRLWRAFTIPATNAVRKANLLITADNSYRLYLDGREIGQGGNWNGLTDYDLTWLLTPGRHVLAVEAFNDGLEGGIIAGLHVQLANGERLQVLSDKQWRIVPENVRRWQYRTQAEPSWPAASEVGVVGQFPWWRKPANILAPPPLRPVEYRFWQSGWFLGAVLTVCIVALALSVRLAAKLAVQTRAQKLLERERARIARDIHDDLGSALTQLVLQGEVAQTEFPQGSAARGQLDQLCDRARNVSHALEEVLWVVNSKRDTLRDFSSYVCKYAQSFLSPTPIRCRLDVQSELPATVFDLPVRRGLFLAVKEALNNAAKHSGATELFLRIHRTGDNLVVEVEDNGHGFDATLLSGEGNGLSNMQQRLQEMGGACVLVSEPGTGCRVQFIMPLASAAAHNAPWWRQLFQTRHRTTPDTERMPAQNHRGLTES